MERPELSISVQRTPSEAVVGLTGEIDLSTAPRLSNTVAELLVEAPARVVLDMAGVTFCDSQGLGTLVVLSRKATLARYMARFGFDKSQVPDDLTMALGTASLMSSNVRYSCSLARRMR